MSSWPIAHSLTDSSETLLLDDFAVAVISLYLGHVVHPVAAHHYQVRAVLVKSACLKVAII